MSRSEIVVISAIPPELRAFLSKEHRLIELKRGDGALPGYDVAVTISAAGADAAVMAQLPDLQLLLCNGAGLDAIDLAEAARRRIIVRSTPDEVTDDTADFAIGLMYAVSRRIAEADRFVRGGLWAKERMTASRRLFDRRLGIVGLGKIGRVIAKRAAGLGMTVLYTGPRAKPDTAYEFVRDIEELACRVDLLVLSCPGGPGTKHLVGEGVLRELGRDGILINVARGSVIDEVALLAALEAKAIAGAGLDVFATEPSVNPRFLAFENVVLTPHYAAVTRESRQAMAETLGDAVRAFRTGERVQDAARPTRAIDP